MKKTYAIEVDCANCANLMEEAANKTEGVASASVNFMMQKMSVEFAEGADEKNDDEGRPQGLQESRAGLRDRAVSKHGSSASGAAAVVSNKKERVRFPMTKKQKKMLIRICIAIVLLLIAKFVPMPGVVRIVLFAVTYLVIGYDILKKAAKGIGNGRVFDENFLMAIATLGAIALAVYKKDTDLTEAVAVMLFYQIGELFQSYAVGKSRRNITALMDIRPDYANIETDGKLEQVDPDDRGNRQRDRRAAGRKGADRRRRRRGHGQSQYQRADRREPAA